MSRQKMINQTIAIRTGTLIMNRRNEYWGPEELELLRKRFYAGIPVNEIAIELERSEDEVYDQIKQMKLYAAPSSKIRKRYTTFGGHVRFCYSSISDSSPSDLSTSLLFRRHFKEGHADV